LKFAEQPVVERLNLDAKTIVGHDGWLSAADLLDEAGLQEASRKLLVLEAAATRSQAWSPATGPAKETNLS